MSGYNARKLQVFPGKSAPFVSEGISNRLETALPLHGETVLLSEPALLFQIQNMQVIKVLPPLPVATICRSARPLG
jgi:hypothetical protein